MQALIGLMFPTVVLLFAMPLQRGEREERALSAAEAQLDKKNGATVSRKPKTARDPFPPFLWRTGSLVLTA